MPLFTVEENRIADSIGVSTLTIFLHTGAPSNASPDNGLVTVGGGFYETGAALTAGNISVASNGDIQNTAAINFGAADEAVGTVTYWKAKRGNANVAWGTVPSTAIANGGSFSINANSMRFNGSST